MTDLQIGSIAKWQKNRVIVYTKHQAELMLIWGVRSCTLAPTALRKAKERYNRLKAEWLVNRHAAKFLQSSELCKTGPTMAEVCIAYLGYAETYYANSTEYVNLELACRPVAALYSDLDATEFGVSRLS